MKDTTRDESPSLFKRLLSRRVPQIICIYLAACWTILQFIDWIVNRYALSPHLPDLALIIFLAMIPSILIVAYFHGRPGKNRWHRAETFGIPINVVAVVCLSFFLFSGKDLGSTQKKVTVSDESGKVVEKVIPKSQFRKKIALFFFENRSGAPENDWLQYAVPYMLQIDLSQDLYIEALSPKTRNLTGLDYYVFNKIREAGFPSGIGLPPMLMKKIAGDVHQDYFLSGGIARQGADFRIDFSLYRSEDMKMMDQGAIVNADIFAAVDQLTVRLKQGLEIPSGHLAKTLDLPVGDIFTRSLPAARFYTDAINEMILNQDWTKAIESLEQAVKADASFAYANLELSALYVLTNKTAEWKSIQKTLLQQSYKLPERQQYLTKADYYYAMQEPEKQMAVLNMMIGLYPDDISTYYLRAVFYSMRDKLDLALADYRKIQEIDPQNRQILLEIANLYDKKGDNAQAEKYYREYGSFFPNSTEADVALGKIKRKQGAHDQAKEFFQKALLISPGDIGILIESGKTEFELGQFAESLAIYEQALSAADSAEDKYKVYGALEGYYSRRGQMKKALEYFDRKIVEYKKFSAPLVVMFEEIFRAELLVLNGRSAEAFQSLALLKKQTTPPWDKFLAMGSIEAYLARKKADEAETCLPDVQAVIKAMGVDALQPYILRTRGQIAQIREEYAKAVEYYLELEKQSPGISITDRNLTACYRYLKEYDRAEESLKKALLISPFDAGLNREAAQLYWEMGKKEEALNFLKKAEMIWHDADPEYEPARKVREQLKAWGI